MTSAIAEPPFEAWRTRIRYLPDFGIVILAVASCVDEFMDFSEGKDGKTAHRRSVRIGRQNPSFYEVTEGLLPGERVVLGGYDNFGDCTKLIIE